MFCRRCGTENDDNMSYCKECGAPLRERREEKTAKSIQNQEHAGNESRSNNTFFESSPQRYESSFSKDSIPPEYKPISMWGYFGYQVLFAIPLIGLILLLVFSFGGTQNRNLKNFARSYFCYLILMIVLIVIVVTSVGGLGMLRYF